MPNNYNRHRACQKSFTWPHPRKNRSKQQKNLNAMEKLVKTVKEWSSSRKPEVELSRSQYSLVSCNDLTAGAVQLWLGLPEEVKYDPALAPFRQFYEKEHGTC